MSLTDELTGLHNRRAFLTIADQRLQLLERGASLCLLIFADVDGLKAANDTMGHEAGDRRLVDAARVLQSSFRRTDLVARMGGDEFVVLADAEIEHDAELVLEKLQPLIALRNLLPPERYSVLMTQLDELVDQFNRATDGTVAIDAEYLLVVASKP